MELSFFESFSFRFQGPLSDVDAAKNLAPAAACVLAPRMPSALRAEILAWPFASKSPFSDSWYDRPGKDWDHTPEGCLRVSDHWNFLAKGRRHCPTSKPMALGNGAWALGRWNGTAFDILFEARPAGADEAKRAAAESAAARTFEGQRLLNRLNLKFPKAVLRASKAAA